MRRIAKHNAVQLSFNDFSGGINTSTAGDLIAQNEMQTCDNFLFMSNQKDLRPRGGLSSAKVTFPADIVGTYYDIDSNTMLVFLNDGSIYHMESSASSVKIGNLTGGRRPSCAKFMDKIWIASGDKLQYYDFSVTDSISTVIGGPTCDIVFQRFARLCVSMTGTNRIQISATGDGTGWTTDDNDSSTSQWVDVGYGDSGDIIAVVPLATDLLMIKNNGMVYQLTGDADVSSWSVYRIATNTYAVGRQCAESIGNDVVFISREGLKTLSTTMDYGNIATGDIGEKFTKLIITSQYESRLFILRKRKILLIRPTADWSFFIAFNYALGSATTLRFSVPINDIIETLDGVIVAAGSSLHEWNDTYLLDIDSSIEYNIKLKDTISGNKILVRSIDSDMEASQAGDVSISIDSMKVTEPANARQKIRCNHSTDCLSVELSSNTPFRIKHVILEVADL